MSSKLAAYEKLPQDRKFLGSMPVQEVFQAASLLVKDPYKVWDLIEECWHPKFLERVCLRVYGAVIDENSD